MVVSLPCLGGGCGGHGRGRGAPPFRDREHNPRLMSNSSNTTLAASVSRLSPAPGQPAFASLLPSPALPLPPLSPSVVVYTDDVAASATGSEPDPFSGRTSANNAVAKLTRSALMISILAKNDSLKITLRSMLRRPLLPELIQLIPCLKWLESCWLTHEGR
jgi:hypothetical protein